MTVYENPQIPEGINVSPGHPLKDFAILLLSVSAILLAAVLLLSEVAGYLVRYVPFAQEQALVNNLSTNRWQQPDSSSANQKQQYLQKIADQLAAEMDLPKGMSITVHYSKDATVNAMATLGGHIIIFQGLLDVMPNENALAMVVAHEIAHVRHRHPIVALGRGFTVLLAISSLTGVGDEVMQRWVNNMGMLTLLSYSRTQEAGADVDALQALLKVYGHVEGASAFFEHVAEQPQPDLSEMFSTHPGGEDRVAQIRQFAHNQDVAGAHVLRPLPDFLKSREQESK